MVEAHLVLPLGEVSTCAIEAAFFIGLISKPSDVVRSSP